MNLRILKKLSKRAAPYLPLLGDNRQQFPSEKDDNYHGLIIRAKKHWQRCVSVHADAFSSCEGEYVIAPKCRQGTRYPYIHVRPPSHPWPGTVMVGAMQGYYEPEWDEECAWSALHSIVTCHFTDWDAVAREDDSVAWSTRRLRTPADIFRAANDIITEKQEADPWLD